MIGVWVDDQRRNLETGGNRPLSAVCYHYRVAWCLSTANAGKIRNYRGGNAVVPGFFHHVINACIGE